MICSKCGKENLSGAAYCAGCGSTLVPNSAGGIQKQANTITLKKSTAIIICAIVIALIFSMGVVIVVSNVDKLSFGGNSIVGAWKDDSGNVRFEFFEDGTCSGTGASYYEATENGVLTTFDSYHYPDDKLYYKVEKDKLYIAENKADLQENIEQGICFERNK